MSPTNSAKLNTTGLLIPEIFKTYFLLLQLQPNLILNKQVTYSPNISDPSKLISTLEREIKRKLILKNQLSDKPAHL